ncbi:MAG: hypothetical protein ACE5JL_16415, partial [Dehalococcoidia bacterium]
MASLDNIAGVVQRRVLGAGWGAFYPRPPAVVWVPAAMVAGAMALPLVYLVLRAAGADASLWDVLIRSRTLAIVGRSALL